MKRGSGWANDKWSRFGHHQNNASVQVAKSIVSLNGLSSRLLSGAGLTAMDKKSQSLMDTYLASGAGSDHQAVFRLVHLAVKMLTVLQSQKPVNYVLTMVNTASGYPGFMSISSVFFTGPYSDSDRDQIVAHEAFHMISPGNRDTEIQLRNGEYIGGYGRDNAIKRAKLKINALASNLNNPDAVTFSLGFDGGRK
jgi:hypothetical protein